MMMERTILSDDEVWPSVGNKDLWLFDKLILSRKLGHKCGPATVPVPEPNYYIVRPCVNLAGMGAGAKIIWLVEDTDHLPAGYFWQEVFKGRHLSVDYYKGKQIRCTEGIPGESIQRWQRWIVTDDKPVLPDIILDVVERYNQVNIEMIDNNIIEVHLRGNPDFDDGAVECIPVWHDSIINIPDGFVYVESSDGPRMGFYKRYE